MITHLKKTEHKGYNVALCGVTDMLNPTHIMISNSLTGVRFPCSKCLRIASSPKFAASSHLTPKGEPESNGK